MKQTIAGHARLLSELKKSREEERREQRNGFRNIWFGLAGLAVTIVLAGIGAFVQMGMYIERIDNVVHNQDNIVRRLDNLATQRAQPSVRSGP